MRTRLSILALSLAAVACKSREADFTIVSNALARTENIEDVRAITNPPKMEIEVYRHWMFIFPLGSKPTIEDAIDKLLKQSNGDVGVDVVIYDKSWWIPFIYGRSGWLVEGRVIDTRIRLDPPPRR